MLLFCCFLLAQIKCFLRVFFNSHEIITVGATDVGLQEEWPDPVKPAFSCADPLKAVGFM